MPPLTVQRYQHERTRARCAIWRRDLPTAEVQAGKTLRVDLTEPARVRWTGDGWRSFTDTETIDTGLGLHVVELPTADRPPGTRFTFTWLRLGTQTWEGQDYVVTIVETQRQFACGNRAVTVSV
jgi:glucoamylase